MNKSVYLIIILGVLGAIYILMPNEESQAQSLEDGIKLARDQDKLIFLYVNGEWCTYCKLLESQFSQSEEFQNLVDDHYIWVTLAFEKNPTIVRRFNLRGPPALFVLDQNGSLIMEIIGYPPHGVSDVIFMLEEALR
jgi:thioredoxin-related protein